MIKYMITGDPSELIKEDKEVRDLYKIDNVMIKYMITGDPSELIKEDKEARDQYRLKLLQLWASAIKETFEERKMVEKEDIKLQDLLDISFGKYLKRGGKVF